MPEAAPRLPPLREVIARHGLRARKALGQHFLLDLNLTGRIARAVPGFLPGAAGDLSQGTVVEVGPGPGGLTRALLAEGGRRVIAVEKDRRCLGALAELAAAYPGRLEILEGDALEIDAARLGAAPRRIVANLPYNVATPLLLRWLAALADDPAAFAGFVLMFQKEVAERLSARPRSKDYGRLTVVTQWLCEARSLFEVPARAFTPPPKVASTVIGVRPRARPLAPAALGALERVTAAAFGQRRKMLRQSLKALGVDVAALLAAAGVPETARAEELEVEAFCALARALAGGA
ncbi:MAG: 16S rRNA (adenine(1518)-N(6)/adenine(1519)-N(6))-dimethyltransferase RsmA [Kiloniellaceae bacterium]